MKYRVKVLYLAGKARIVHKSGDIVTQDMLNEKAEKLVVGGYLEPLSDDTVQSTGSEDAALDQQPPSPPVDDKKNEDIIPPLKVDATRDAIIADLTLWEVPFSNAWSKEELFELWKKHSKV